MYEYDIIKPQTIFIFPSQLMHEVKTYQKSLFRHCHSYHRSYCRNSINTTLMSRNSMKPLQYVLLCLILAFAQLLWLSVVQTVKLCTGKYKNSRKFEVFPLRRSCNHRVLPVPPILIIYAVATANLFIEYVSSASSAT